MPRFYKQFTAPSGGVEQGTCECGARVFRTQTTCGVQIVNADGTQHICQGSGFPMEHEEVRAA